jgi:hypothetical protein
MNRKTVVASIALAGVLYPAVHAQTSSFLSRLTPPVPVFSPSPSKDATVPDAQDSDSSEATNAIRIVRLSQANGKVEMDRNIESAMKPPSATFPSPKVHG